MWEYRYQGELSMDSFNILGDQGWEVFYIKDVKDNVANDIVLKRDLLIEAVGEGNPVTTFSIKKDFTYGEITQIYILGFIFFVVLFYVLKKLFTHESVDILNFKRTTNPKI